MKEKIRSVEKNINKTKVQAYIDISKQQKILWTVYSKINISIRNQTDMLDNVRDFFG